MQFEPGGGFVHGPPHESFAVFGQVRAFVVIYLPDIRHVRVSGLVMDRRCDHLRLYYVLGRASRRSPASHHTIDATRVVAAGLQQRPARCVIPLTVDF